jgi:glycine oxidase
MVSLAAADTGSRLLSDFLICGAGVSGMLLARELVAAGASVHLVERSESGREASWAGGGIVSPLYPWRYADPVTALAQQAQASYPQLAASLMEETGIDPELSVCGLMMLDADDHEDALCWASRQQRQMFELDRQQILAKEPLLSEGHDRALWMPDIANIRNPRLMKALKVSLQFNPQVRFSEHTEVLRFDKNGARVTGVQVKQGSSLHTLGAENYVVCAGAWSGDLLRKLDIELAVAPVKGQMLLYKSDKALLSSIVLTKGRYLIPRRDHHILVGSTLEYMGFDKTASEEARTSLQESAENMLPALKQLPVVGQWAGLRPGAPGGVPFIGRAAGYHNLYVNAGHFRNGLVLAPASARLLAELLMGKKPSIDPAPYDPMR